MISNPGMLFSIRGYLRISRPVNLVITAVSVFVAGVIATNYWMDFVDTLLLASLSAALIAAGGNVLNDYCDRDLDRRQKPHRPIPSGHVTVKGALLWAWICFTAGLIVALTLGKDMFIIAISATVLLLLYNLYWKRVPLIGNLAVALTASLAFIYGGIAVRSISTALWVACLAFLFHLGREITKDIEDQQGDAECRVQTLVVRYGLSAGQIAATIAFCLLILYLPFPHLLGPFNAVYFYITVFGILPVLILAILWTWCWNSPRMMHKLNVILKTDMILGLIALLLGKSG
ncbi:hypothetical protein CEE37_04915 [candidate division LCP-89 bacterium B3_LCP]|uniref:Geranylgeranylglycerol-phosphate geranylgeranyltransferase n=1 Tax=candidate division LCP-89 bacterium B3_LCP TaxID=2012998 RepID=A0A532V1G0_UNCL8|nr:MAG: hypothetical protein CEE37_04915 [candidate division LCP-89 bacterium B3_LCP]